MGPFVELALWPSTGNLNTRIRKACDGTAAPRIPENQDARILGIRDPPGFFVRM